MIVSSYRLFLQSLVVEARIGIHDFERDGAQRLRIDIEMELALDALPATDDIALALDYDWVRDEARRLAAAQHYDLQETLARSIIAVLAARPEIVRVVVVTAKPDVYADVEAVGCRLEAHRIARG